MHTCTALQGLPWKQGMERPLHAPTPGPTRPRSYYTMQLNETAPCAARGACLIQWEGQVHTRSGDSDRTATEEAAAGRGAGPNDVSRRFGRADRWSAGLAGALGGADQRPAPRAPGQNQRPAPRAPERPWSRQGVNIPC